MQLSRLCLLDHPTPGLVEMLRNGTAANAAPGSTALFQFAAWRCWSLRRNVCEREREIDRRNWWQPLNYGKNMCRVWSSVPVTSCPSSSRISKTLLLSKATELLLRWFRRPQFEVWFTLPIYQHSSTQSHPNTNDHIAVVFLQSAGFNMLRCPTFNDTFTALRGCHAETWSGKQHCLLPGRAAWTTTSTSFDGQKNAREALIL